MNPQVAAVDQITDPTDVGRRLSRLPGAVWFCAATAHSLDQADLGQSQSAGNCFLPGWCSAVWRAALEPGSGWREQSVVMIRWMRAGTVVTKRSRRFGHYMKSKHGRVRRICELTAGIKGPSGRELGWRLAPLQGGP